MCRPTLLVLALGLVLGLWRIGSVGLTDPSEGRYAEIAREMADSRDWLVPRLWGVVHLEKPPLAYWLGAAAIRIGGRTEWAVRLFPLLALLGTAILAAGIARRVAGAGASPLAAAAIMLAPYPLSVGPALLTDVFVLLGVTLFHHSALRHERKECPSAANVAALGLAIGFLAKGHTVFLFTLLPLLLTAPRRLRLLLRPGPLLCFLLPAVPWFVAIQMRYPEFLSTHAGKLADFVAEGEQHHRAPFYVYVATLALGVAPFTLGLVPGIRAIAPAERRVLLAWLLVPLAVLTAIRSRSWTYILPSVPPLAVLGAAGYAATDAAYRRRLRGGLCLGGGGIALLATILLPSESALGRAAPMALPLAIALCLGGAAILLWRGAPRGATAILLAFAVGAALVQAAAHFETPFKIHRRLAARIASELDPGRPLVAFDVVLPSLAFYLDRPVVTAGLHGRVGAEARLWGASPLYRPEARLEALFLMRPAPLIVLPRAALERVAPDHSPVLVEGDCCVIDAIGGPPRAP